MAHHWRTPKKRGAKCLYISGAPPGAPVQIIIFLGLRWRQAATKLGDQGFPGDTHDPPTAANLVQARLQLNQGVDANLSSLGINSSYLIFFRFHLFFFVYVLIVIVLLIGSHLRQQKGLERQIRKLVGVPLAHPF